MTTPEPMLDLLARVDDRFLDRGVSYDDFSRMSVALRAAIDWLEAETPRYGSLGGKPQDGRSYSRDGAREAFRKSLGGADGT